MGHTIKRCKQPIKEDENAPGAAETFGDAAAGAFDSGAGAGDFDAPAAGGNEWDTSAAATGGSAHNDWETSQPVAVAAVGTAW